VPNAGERAPKEGRGGTLALPMGGRGGPPTGGIPELGRGNGGPPPAGGGSTCGSAPPPSSKPKGPLLTGGSTLSACVWGHLSLPRAVSRPLPWPLPRQQRLQRQQQQRHLSGKRSKKNTIRMMRRTTRHVIKAVTSNMPRRTASEPGYPAPKATKAAASMYRSIGDTIG